MSSSPAHTDLTAVLAPLADSLPELTTTTCAQIYDELDAYSTIPFEALSAAVRRNLGTAMTALRKGEVPGPERLDGAAQTARERFEAGVPVEEIVRGFRISIALIHERFVDLAVTLQLPADLTVAGVRLMWGVADAFTTRIITEYHSLQVDTALRDAQRRVAAVRALLAGEDADPVIVAGLDATAEYAAIQCDAPDDASGELLRQSLEDLGSTPSAAALVVVADGQCLGIVATPPLGIAQPIGIGPFGRIEDLPRSNRVARQSLRLARRLGRTGLQGIEELGWRLAAAARRDVWHHYAETFLTPLDAEGDFGAEVRAAVRAWLDAGRSIPRAAASLTVHVNTVRYRLARFADLTGCDLDDPDDLIGVTWALELGRPD